MTCLCDSAGLAKSQVGAPQSAETGTVAFVQASENGRSDRRRRGSVSSSPRRRPSAPGADGRPQCLVFHACSQFGDRSGSHPTSGQRKRPKSTQEQLFCRFPKPDVAGSSPVVRFAGGHGSGSCRRFWPYRFVASLPQALRVPAHRSPSNVRWTVEGLIAAPAVPLLLSPFVDRDGSAVPASSADLTAGRGWEGQRGLFGRNGLPQRPDC
jgi:hypothetical protein